MRVTFNGYIISFHLFLGMANNIQPSVSSDEENGLRLFLLVEESTKILRRSLLAHLVIREEDFDRILNRSVVKRTLNKLNKNILAPEQLKKLYPPQPETADINNLDISLLCILYLNLKKPADNIKCDVETLRDLRNKVIHKPLPTSQSLFDTLWFDISNVLRNFGADLNGIARLKTKLIDKKETDRLTTELKELKESEERHAELTQKYVQLQGKYMQLEKANREGMWHKVPENVPTFTSRHEEITHIQEILKTVKNNKDSGIILHGMGGVGKTEVAIRFCRTYHKDYDNILWVDMESDSNAKSSFLEIANSLQLEILNLSLDSIIQKIYQFFSSQETLVILDNVQSSTNIKMYMPKLPPEATKPIFIMTSQSRLGNLNNFVLILIDTFPPETSETFITEQLSETQIDVTPCQEDVAGLAEAIGNLPLALQQSVSYIKTHNISIQKYLTYFKSHFGELDVSFNTHEKTILTTIQLSLNSLNEIPLHCTPLAIEVLRVCACLFSSKISSAFLYNLSNEDEININNAISILVQQSLLKETTNIHKERYVSMHNITRKVIQHIMRENSTLQKYTKISFSIIYNTIHSKDEENLRIHYNYGHSWFPHLSVLLDESDCIDLLLSMKPMLPHMMQVFENKSDFESAEVFFDSFNRKILKYETGDLKFEINNMVTAIQPCIYFSCTKERKFDEAVELFKISNFDIANTGDDEFLNVVTEEILQSLIDSNDNDNIYIWKRYLLLIECSKAATYTFIEFNKHYENILTSTRDDVTAKAFIRAHLGIYALSQKQHTKGEQYLREAYEIKLHAVGSRDKMTLQLKFWIGIVLSEQDKWNEALDCFQDVYKSRKETLGEEDMETIFAKRQAALSLFKIGEIKQALDVMQEVIGVQIPVFGSRHELACDTKYIFAVELVRMGIYDIAFSILLQVYTDQVEILGIKHKRTITTMTSLAEVFLYKEMKAEALSLYIDIYIIIVERFGVENEDVIKTRCWVLETFTKILKDNMPLLLYDEICKELVKCVDEKYDTRTYIQLSHALLLCGHDMNEGFGVLKELYEECREYLGDNNMHTIFMQILIINFNSNSSNDGKKLNVKVLDEVYTECIELFGEEDEHVFVFKEFNNKLTTTNNSMLKFEELLRNPCTTDFKYNIASMFTDIGMHVTALALLSDIKNKSENENQYSVEMFNEIYRKYNVLQEKV